MKTLISLFYVGIPVIFLLTLTESCTTKELTEWKELAEDTREDTNKELLEKAKKKKKKALKKLEKL